MINTIAGRKAPKYRVFSPFLCLYGMAKTSPNQPRSCKKYEHLPESRKMVKNTPFLSWGDIWGDTWGDKTDILTIKRMPFNNKLNTELNGYCKTQHPLITLVFINSIS